MKLACYLSVALRTLQSYGLKDQSLKVLMKLAGYLSVALGSNTLTSPLIGEARRDGKMVWAVEAPEVTVCGEMMRILGADGGGKRGTNWYMTGTAPEPPEAWGRQITITTYHIKARTTMIQALSEFYKKMYYLYLHFKIYYKTTYFTKTCCSALRYHQVMTQS